MQNATLIYNYPRQPNVTVVIVSSGKDKFELPHINTAMALYAIGGGTVLEVVRYNGDDVTGTIHFPNPASIELKGDPKP